MSVGAGTPFKSSRVFSLDGKRYKVLPQQQGSGARTWLEERVSIQDAPQQQYSVPLASFHQGSGFTYDGLDNTYAWASGWDASSPGRIRTWPRLATAESASIGSTLPRGRLGWLHYDEANGYLYMLRGRYVSKYLVDLTSSSWSKAVADKDLGATNVVAGRPALWGGKLYIPIANTSNVAQVFQELTFGGAGADTYTAGPAGAEALCFTTWRDLLVKGTGVTVSTCATTPTTLANWGSSATISSTGVFAKAVTNTSDTIVDLLTYDQYLLVRTSRGLWSFTEGLKVVNELPDLASIIDWEGAGGAYSNGRLFQPHKSGLVAWRPGSWANVGPEQEGGTEADQQAGWGRTRYCQPYGRYLFTSVNNTTNLNGYIVMYVPARVQGRGPLIPYCVHSAVLDVSASQATFEGMCVIDSATAGADTGSALAVIEVQSAGLAATPYIFKLPRSGMTPTDDAGIAHATSLGTSDFYTSRITKPLRSIQKKYRSFECWLDMSPTSNTPGLKVYASVDGAAEFQLLDSTGAAATVLTSGFQTFYFPKTTAAVGGHVRLRFYIAGTSGGQSALDCTIREGVLRMELRPLKASVVKTTLILDSDLDLEDRGRITRTGPKQEAELRALDTRSGASSGGIAYTGPNGETGYVELRSLAFSETSHRQGEPPVKLAHLEMAVSLYA